MTTPRTETTGFSLGARTRRFLSDSIRLETVCVGDRPCDDLRSFLTILSSLPLSELKTCSNDRGASFDSDTLRPPTSRVRSTAAATSAWTFLHTPPVPIDLNPIRPVRAQDSRSSLSATAADAPVSRFTADAAIVQPYATTRKWYQCDGLIPPGM